MTIWMAPPTERLKKWRKFRQSIGNENLHTSLQELVDWFKTAPLSSRFIDVYDSTHWPGPWDLLYVGDMDENTISLAMGYSLQLAEVDCEILLVQDREKSFLGLVVLVDKNWVLGYTYGNVEPISILDTCSVIERYDPKELLKTG